MRKYRWRWVISIMVCALLLVRCQPQPSGPHIEWEYIIPDNYTGYLAIQYDCPNGIPINVQNNIAHIVFKPDGTYCTSDLYSESWSSNDRAWSTSGTSIPFVDPPSNQQGYALCCGSTLVIGGGTQENPGKDITVFLQWVGDMARVNASWPALPDNQDDFFAERFGLQDPFSQPNP